MEQKGETERSLRIIPSGVYAWVWVALLVLLAGTIAVARFHFTSFSVVINLFISTAKAALVLQARAAERLTGMLRNQLIASQALDRLRAQVGGDQLDEALDFGLSLWYRRLGWTAQSRAALKVYRQQHADGLFAPLLAEPKGKGPAGRPDLGAAAPASGGPSQTIRAQAGAPRLGLLLPLSGPNMQLGRDLLDGAQLANREQGSPFELIPLDTGFDYDTLPIAEGQDSELVRTARAIRRLIEDARVLAVVGPVFSAPAVAATVAAEGAGVPLVLPLAQQSGLDSLGRYTFQLRTNPEIQGRALGEYATLGLGLKSLVVLAPLTDYGWNFNREFSRAAQANGGKVVYRDWYLPDQQKDFKRTFDDIRKVGLALKPPPVDTLGVAAPDTMDLAQLPLVDGIDGMAMVVESFEDAKTIAPQLRFYQVRTQVLGNDIWYDPEALRQMSPSARQELLGCMFVSGRDEETPAAKQFAEQFGRQFGRQSAYAVYGYDAARLVIEGWRAGRRERGPLRDWLAGVQGYAGASGPISFSQGRRTNSELKMMKINRRGQIVPASQPEPPDEPPPETPELAPAPGDQTAPNTGTETGH